MASIETPHFAFPFRRNPNGQVAVVEQGSEQEISGCELVIASCPIGFRPDRPEFGWEFPTFKNAPLDLGSLETALRTWEPRGKATASQMIDLVIPGAVDVEVDIEVEEDSSGSA